MDEELKCSKRRWYVHLNSSIITFFVGLMLTLCHRFVKGFCKCPRKVNLIEVEKDSPGNTPRTTMLKTNIIHYMSSARKYAGIMISGQNNPGKVLITASFVLSVGSQIIYIYEMSFRHYYIEWCRPWSKYHLAQIDFSFNIFFLVCFWVGYLAAQDHVSYWLEMYSIVDCLTIPPVFVNIYLNQYWMGLRFLRCLRLMSLPSVLQFLGILTSGSTIRLAQLSTIFLSIWLTGAGFIHLLENGGDPFRNGDVEAYANAQNMTYGEAMYFTIVTMSTVGFGDINAVTTLGRLFVIFFVLFALAIFASYTPEIASILLARNRYSGSYRKEHGKHHVIVCGDVTTQTTSNFLSDFLHPDRECVNVEVVFINPAQPDLSMQSLIKRHYTRVEYFQGSVLNIVDLERIKMNSADACLVLANQCSHEPDAEDAANILRVISVKNACPNVRVVMQLLHYHNKAHLLNIPNWDWRKGDDIVCFSELKMGFLAQSCLAPGFSTVISNLFSMRSADLGDLGDSLTPWQVEYLKGVAMEIYSDHFSSAFTNMTFAEAASLCKSKLNLLLLAIEARKEESDDHYLAINPDPSVRVLANTQGFFICDTQEIARRARYYCAKCHADVRNPELITQCACSKQSQSHKMGHALSMQSAKVRQSIAIKPPGEKIYDITGMYHWCEEQHFDSVAFSKPKPDLFGDLHGHVIVCVFADSKSPPIGLVNFVMPLRASNLRFEELKPIVFVGNVDFLRNEWELLCNFPKIYLISGSPLSRTRLRSVHIDRCDMCVVLSAKGDFTRKDDPYLIDKEVILCSLNIQGMRFGPDSFINQVFEATREKKEERIHNPATSRMSTELDSMVQMITELHVDGNLQFLDQDDDDTTGVAIYLTQPFACGTAFTESVLDSLVSSAYFNTNALTLIRTLVTGGATQKLEMILAEGMGFQGSPETQEVIRNRTRCRIEQLTLKDPRFNNLQEKLTYGELCSQIMEGARILCLALYRFQGTNCLPADKPARRYVITNPDTDFEVFSSDLLICICPFDPNIPETRSQV